MAEGTAPDFHLPVPSTQVFAKDVFKGKVLFCTGGGTGICYHIVNRMMQHGARAVILGRRKEVIEASAKRLTEQTGNECIGISGDVRNFDSMKKAAEQAVQTFGAIDMVICGAAGNFLSPLDGLSANAFKTVIEIDVLGTYNTIKATAPYVKDARGSYISISATLHYTATIMQAHVGAAKAAIDALSQSVAVEWGPFGVRSNIIAPDEFHSPGGGPGGEDLIRQTPLQRIGQLDDVANAAIFLFSPAASFITGSIVVVDGGELHMKSQNTMIPYPDLLLAGGNFREVIKAML